MKRLIECTFAAVSVALVLFATSVEAKAGCRHHRHHGGHVCVVEVCEPAPVVEECVVEECVVEECGPRHGCHRRHRCGLFGRRHHRHHHCDVACPTDACGSYAVEPAVHVSVESPCGSGCGEVVSSGCAGGDCGGGGVISEGAVTGEVSRPSSGSEAIKKGTPTPAEPTAKATTGT